MLGSTEELRSLGPLLAEERIEESLSLTLKLWPPDAPWDHQDVEYLAMLLHVPSQRHPSRAAPLYAPYAERLKRHEEESGWLKTLSVRTRFVADFEGDEAAMSRPGELSKQITPPNNGFAYLLRGRLLLDQGRADETLKDVSDIDLQWEAERALEAMPGGAEVLTQKAELHQLAPQADVLYVATHGHTPETAGRLSLPSRNEEAHERALLFDGGRIGPRDFFSGEIKLKRGAVVILSACSAGRLMPGEAHELQGLVRSLFFAGAATVLAARWPIINVTAIPVFIGTLGHVFERRQPFARGLSQALKEASATDDLWALMGGPESSTFFWGGFTLYGCGD